MGVHRFAAIVALTMRALITNDDGIDSRGIRTLAQVAVAAGLQVTVAAPDEERSGYGTALIGLEEGGRLLVDERRLEGLDGVEAYAVHASPAMIALVAVRGGFGAPPDVVLSGVNHGRNTGRGTLHSGTVGAALTGSSLGLPALAVSFDTEDPVHWDTARAGTEQALRWFLDHRAEQDEQAEPHTLNVNVPNVPPERLRGLRAARLADFGAARATIGERGRGFVTMTLSEGEQDAEEGTDLALLREGWVTLTPLRGPSVVDAADLAGLRAPQAPVSRA